MIGKIKKGKGFRGALNYLLRGDDCKIIGGNMGGTSPRELAREFSFLRNLRESVANPVVHISLSAHPEDRALSDKEFALIAQGLVDELGYKNTSFVVIRHQDTQHQHIHLLLSKIDFNGRLVNDSHDYRKTETYLRKIEEELQLIEVRNKIKTKKQEKRMATKNKGAEIKQVCMMDATVLLPQKEASKRSRDSRRFVIDESYEEWIRRYFSDDLISVYQHPKGAVLYFSDPKKIRDDGDRITALGMPDEKEAAEKLVALAIAKGWTRVALTGSASFIYETAQLALEKGIEVVPSDINQAPLIDEIKAKVAASKLTHSNLPLPTTSLLARLQERRRLIDKEKSDVQVPIHSEKIKF